MVNGWGDGVDITALGTALKADVTFGDLFKDVTFANNVTSAQDVATVINDSITTKELSEAFARIVAQNVSGTGTAMVNNAITVDQGYYIIVDTAAATKGDYKSYTLGMLQVVAGATVEATTKIDFPSFDKQIGDINDSATAPEVTYNEAADHDMGDHVPFRLTATIPSNIDKYEIYNMTFHDDLQETVFAMDTNSVKTYYLEEGKEPVEINTTSAVYAASAVEDDAKFNAETKKSDGKEDFTVTIADIKTMKDTTGADIAIKAGGQIVVEYTATLTTDANMGATGNWNGAYLEYSHNPNKSGDGTPNKPNDKEKSPVDYVVAFTYQTLVNKTDGISKQPLTGAGFTLLKKYTNMTGQTAWTTDSTDEKINAYAGDSYVAVTNISLNDAKTSFEFKGLDDGDYVLIETTVPDGYNPVDPIEFTITAEETQTDGAEALASLKSDKETEFKTGKVYQLTGEEGKQDYVNTNGADNGSLTATIENLKGATLPSTGGIGTTLFYLGGGAMVAVAGVFLITKKRMGKREN
ncbi:MAG: isopeptide-forming domain-containing fimbrial protein [Ruminococcus sp.]|nr:isopeptide-forming domain-containing fimbrial protein [Ruminococcus sp.]